MVVPSMNVKDTDTAVVIEAELPGVEEKDVSVTVSDGVLTLKGEKRQEKEVKGESHYLMERSYGSFMRSLRLPETVDESKIEATFEKGVLRITASKRPGTAKIEKRISISKG